MLRTLAVLVAALAACGAGAADISPLTTKATAAAKSGDAVGAIDALEQALEQLRNDAPITLKSFMVVAQPAKFFGDYEPRKEGTVFRKNEKMNFYAEPKNLTFLRNSAGLYEPAFEVDLELKGPDGNTMKQPKFASFRLPTRSRVQDLFLNLTVALSGAPAGKYDVRFIVRDLNSKKTATVDQALTIK